MSYATPSGWKSGKECKSCGRPIENCTVLTTTQQDGSKASFHPWCLRCYQCGASFGKGKIYQNEAGSTFCSSECYHNNSSQSVSSVSTPKPNVHSHGIKTPLAVAPAVICKPKTISKTKNIKQAQFCGSCGTKRNSSVQKFCMNCGGSL